MRIVGLYRFFMEIFFHISQVGLLFCMLDIGDVRNHKLYTYRNRLDLYTCLPGTLDKFPEEVGFSTRNQSLCR